MRIEVLDYVAQLRRGDIGLLLAVVPFVATYIWVWMLWRALPGFRELGVLSAMVIGAAATVGGLMLTSVAYRCSSCQAHEAGCQVEALGWPLRQGLRDVDPEPMVFHDACRSAQGPVTSAVVVNFGIGALGVPLLIAVGRLGWGRRRRVAGGAAP